jgi:2,4-dienoyl-CoA reductase-like NADH-dependent reductase (Old Yellow Enzyme family)
VVAASYKKIESASAPLDSGMNQMAVCGRPFIANPDLVARFAAGVPLAAPREGLFYTPGPEGYSDYPSLAA